MGMRYFWITFFSLSILNSFSQEFNSEDCYDYVAVNVKLEKASTKDSISRKELINSKRIIAEGSSVKIINFTYVFDGCEIVERKVESDTFSELDKSAFQKLRPGNFLLFEKIKAIDDNGKTVYLKPFWYRIY